MIQNEKSGGHEHVRELRSSQRWRVATNKRNDGERKDNDDGLDGYDEPGIVEERLREACFVGKHQGDGLRGPPKAGEDARGVPCVVGDDHASAMVVVRGGGGNMPSKCVVAGEVEVVCRGTAQCRTTDGGFRRRGGGGEGEDAASG